MTNIHISRRALLGGLATAALSGTAGASEIRWAPEALEHPVVKVHGIAETLSEALNDYENGRWQAVVYPSAVYDRPVVVHPMQDFADPLFRLSLAIAQAKKALFDLTGTWPVDTSRIDEKHQVVALGILPSTMTELRWRYDDGGPLLADDVIPHHVACAWKGVRR